MGNLVFRSVRGILSAFLCATASAEAAAAAAALKLIINRLQDVARFLKNILRSILCTKSETSIYIANKHSEIELTTF